MAKSKTDFLAALSKGGTVEQEPQEPVRAAPAAPEATSGGASASAVSRAGKKHIGAYFDKGSDFLEQVALLRARLGMTNAELIQHAVEELYRKEAAARRFGDR